MNRRYTMIESVRIRATGDGEPVEFDVPCSLMPDARDNISGETARIVFTGPKGSADETIASSVQLSVNFNYNTGGITNQATITVNPEATMTYEYVSCTVHMKFTAKNSDKGRVMVSVQNEMQDITIDPTEDFLIALTTEEIQDYRSIFKIDLARTLSEAIKRQILLNKDYDLAYFLKAAEPQIALNNAMFNVNLSNYNTAANAYTPNNVYDVMKGVIPYISSAISTVYRNFQMYPINIYF